MSGPIALVVWGGVLAALGRYGASDGAVTVGGMADASIARAHFTPQEDELILRMTDGRLLSFDLGSRELQVISSSVDGYDSWISPSGRYGVNSRTLQVRDFTSGEVHNLGRPNEVDLLGYLPDADDLLVFRKDPPRWLRQSAATGAIRWEVPDPEGPRQAPRAIWSPSGEMALLAAGGWCRLVGTESGRFIPLHPDFTCDGLAKAVFDDEDLGFVIARRNPHGAVVAPVYYDLRSYQFAELESGIYPVSLSVGRDRLWTYAERSLQERRLSADFELLHEKKIDCVSLVRPFGSEWFVLGCDRRQLQMLRFPGASPHPIGLVLERFGQGVLLASPSGKLVAHSEDGQLQILSTESLDDPAPPFTAVTLPQPGVPIHR